MRKYFREDVLIRRYLLNDLDQDQQRQLELRLISDENFFEELLIVENEIIFDYVTNTLSQQEEEQFESHFVLTPERSQKIEFFKVLNKKIEETPITVPILHLSWKRVLPVFLRETSSALRFSLAVCLLLFLFGG